MSKRITGFVLLLIGVAVGVGAAQVVVLPGPPTSFVNSGLFTLNSDEGVNFHVSLHEGRGGPPATALMRLIDASGTVVARRDVQLGPGQSATLQWLKPGQYRVHAGIVEGSNATGPRRILGTAEIISLRGTSVTGLHPASLRSTRRAEEFEVLRFVSTMHDGGGNGRLPD